MHRPLRRSERQIHEHEARELLKKAEFGILSCSNPDGSPYGIPLSYCLINNTIYFHCAVEGQKLENIAADNRVSFCVVGGVARLPDKFSTLYESVVVSGTAQEVSGEEKQQALEGLLEKYCDGFTTEGLAYIQKKTAKTTVIGIQIEQICGKARRDR